MGLELISFVGVDAHTDLNELDTELPYQQQLELGVLFSKRRMSGRYLPIEDCHMFLNRKTVFQKSLHLCGSEAINDFIEYQPEMLDLVRKADRIQLNFSMKSVEPEKLKERLTNALAEHHHIILQLNKSKKDFVEDFLKSKPNRDRLSILHDGSGGFGRVIQSPESPLENYFTGYAGGIKPDNVASIVEMIDKENPNDLPYYIDMESGIRTDGLFDLDKCIQVIKRVL